MSGLSPGASRAIARFSVGFDAARLSDAHMRMCGRAIADTVAVAIAGWREPAAVRALEYALNLGEAGRGTIWGRGERAGLETAALCNGIAAHALDYDDASSPMNGHPSVVLLPALLALGEARKLQGRQLALAYAVGFEVACAMGRALSQAHYARGWHLTSTLGTMASAVACARLLELDEDATSHAIGLAVAQTGGSRASFGTDAKAFQAGQAASAGLRAALLAETGFTAAADALDGIAGFSALYSEGEPLAEALDRLGSAPMEMDTSGVEIKKYPACYAVHRPLDGLLDLRREHGLSLENVARIDVQASHGALAPLLSRLPASGTEGRFSMHYALAAALSDGGIKLSSFTDAAVMRTGLRAFMARVHAGEAPGAMMPRWAHLQVTLVDGQVLRRRIDALRGSPQLPLTDQELLGKVADCLAWGSSDIDPEAFMRHAMGFSSKSVRELINGITTPGPRAFTEEIL
jgi:2-methylcitrate dehydratase PrpD